MRMKLRNGPLESNPLEGGIRSDYNDTYLGLIQLLVEAASLEHSLMISYLFSLFSIKSEFSNIAGDLTSLSFFQNSPQGPDGRTSLNRPPSLLEIAIEEMQHLSIINKLLVSLGASPHVVPHFFPLSSDLYPFNIELRPFDKFSTATFLWLEASSGSLSLHPEARVERESESLILEIRETLWQNFKILGGPQINLEIASHIGSIYKVILLQFRKLSDSPPPLISPDFPWGEWEQKLRWIMGQGEINHYRFFRDVFTGAAFNFEGNWKIGLARENFFWKSAYPGRKDSIKNEDARQLCWLSNLHYWVILCILDLAYREKDHRLKYTGIDHMTTSLWRLGTHLADIYHVGLPFDSMSTRYSLGKDPRMSREILKCLVYEAENFAHHLDAMNILPQDYSRTQFRQTISSLEAAKHIDL